MMALSNRSFDDVVMNTTSAFIDMAAHVDDDYKNYIFTQFENVNSVNKLNKNIGFCTDRPSIFKADKAEDFGDNVVYTFTIPDTLDSAREFTFLFGNGIAKMDTFCWAKVYKKDMECMEKISKEFLACWEQSFGERVLSKDGMEFYIPFFMNRNNILISAFDKISFCLKFDKKIDQVVSHDDIWISYRGIIQTNQQRKNYRSKYSDEMWMFYDGVMEKDNKWVSMENVKNNHFEMYLSPGKEPFHRLSDLFLMVRSKDGFEYLEPIKSISVLAEETLLFQYPGWMCKSVIQPVAKKSVRIDKKDDKNVYYIPFSSENRLYEEWRPRGYINLANMTNLRVSVQIPEGVDYSNLEICVMSISQVMMKMRDMY